MRLVTVYAPGADPRPLLAAYRAHLDRTGRGNASYWQAARDFFSRWPDPAMWAAEPLETRLAASSAHRISIQSASISSCRFSCVVFIGRLWSLSS